MHLKYTPPSTPDARSGSRRIPLPLGQSTGAELPPTAVEPGLARGGWKPAYSGGWLCLEAGWVGAGGRFFSSKRIWKNTPFFFVGKVVLAEWFGQSGLGQEDPKGTCRVVSV